MQLDQGARAFQEEALELLTEAEEVLLAMEDNPHDTGLIDRLFRAMHTVKGSGAMFGFDEVARFTHEVETALDMARAGTLEITHKGLSLLLQSRDHILHILATPDAATSLHDASDALIARLRAMTGQAGQQTTAAAPTQTTSEAGRCQSPGTWWIRYRPHPDSYLTGTNPLALLTELDAMGQMLAIVHVEAIPELATMNPESVLEWWDILLRTDACEEVLRDVFVFVEDEHDVSIVRLAGEFLRQDDLTEFAGLVGAASMEESAAVRAELESRVAALLARRTPIDEPRHGAEEHPGGGSPSAATASATIRVESTRLDRLVDLVGELVIIHSRLQQRALAHEDAHGRAIAEDLGRVAARLRDETLRIRMVPIGGMFGALRRLVRDLSMELGKEAVFEAEGADTELDKSVIDQLKDPLVHILRNSLDHGLESPEVRAAAGKPAQGTVRLQAAHDSGEVRIVITDDGAGVDLERVRQKALEKGLLAPGEEADERRVIECLFEPGFSTASAVSSVSGRGVGMDVVKQSIEGLRGRVLLETTAGQGTRMTIRLPLTLAIIDGMQVKVGNEYYIIPVSSIVACQERQTSGEATPVDTIPWQERLTPCVSLRALLGVAGQRPPYERIIVTRVEDDAVGLAVDVVIGQQQAVIKPLSDIYRGVDFVSGTAVNGDGGISLILDVPRLVRFATTTAAAAGKL